MRRGFTLIEMLVVIAVIVLAMTLAIPAIRSLTGSRSQEAAENTLSSYVNFVRTEAIGLQRVEGVMFVLDTAADRVKCAAVMETPRQAMDVSGVTYLDLVPDRDPFALPAGVRLWTMKDLPPPPASLIMRPFVEPFPNSRFLGYNAGTGSPGIKSYGLQPAPGQPTLAAIPGGVILFDSSGHLTSQRYGLRLAPGSQLTQLIYSGTAPDVVPVLRDWPNSTAPEQYLVSQIGLVLFDREMFLNQADPSSTTQFTDANDPTGGNLERAMERWLDTNTTIVLVNRYDGNLMRAE